MNRIALIVTKDNKSFYGFKKRTEEGSPKKVKQQQKESSPQKIHKIHSQS